MSKSRKEFVGEIYFVTLIPSECEVKENGVDIVEMQVKLLKSLEELTLHVIELKKENEQLKAEFIKLK